MGKHFDALVELLNSKKKKEYENQTYKSIGDIVKKSTLFELGINAEEIRPITGKDKEEYDLFVHDYLVRSRKSGTFIIRPFDITAVEDKISVVIMKEKQDMIECISCFKSKPEYDNSLPEMTYAMYGAVKIYEPETPGNVQLSMTMLHSEASIDGEILVYNQKNMDESGCYDLGRGAMSYLEQIAYIMDPENFIIKKESNMSRNFREKGKGGKKLEKTVMRPHYICLSETDLRDFITREAKEPKAAHPVRGHWRKLRSERFVNMKNHNIFIPQYFTGDGSIQARGGWNYQVMIKERPDKITEYKQKE